MSTLVNRYVNPDSVGGDGTTSALSGVNAAYVSQASFIINEATDITLDTGTDEYFKVNCATNGTQDTARANYSSASWTTDAANDNWVEVIGDGLPLEWDIVNHYLINPTDEYNGAVEVDIDFKCAKLQISNSGSISSIGINFPGSVAFTIYIENNIINNCGSDTSSHGIFTGNGAPDTVIQYIRNNVIANCGGRGIHINKPSQYIVNNTIEGCDLGLYGYSYVQGAGIHFIANNLVVNNTIDYSHASWHTAAVTHDFNADSDGTLNGNEVNGVENAVVAFASATDWHIDSTGESELIGAGAGPTNATYGAYVLTNDPDGDVRSGLTCDIGSDEYVSAAILLEQEGFKFRLDDGTEITATDAAGQDVNITSAAGETRRIRILLNTTGDLDPSQFQLEVKKSTDPDTAYQKVNL